MPFAPDTLESSTGAIASHFSKDIFFFDVDHLSKSLY